MGGDASIFLNKNTDSGSMHTYGIFSRAYNENTNNLIILKSANMEIYGHGNGAGIDFDHRISSGTSEVTLLNDSQIKVNSSALGANVYGINAEDRTNNHKVIVNTAGIDIDVEGNGYQMENYGEVFKSDTIAVKSNGGVVNIDGFAKLNVTDVENNEEGNGNVFGLFATNGGNINVNGTTTISTSGGQDIAVVAGTEAWKLGEDGKLPVVEENGINTVNLNYQNGAGSEIKGDIISGYGGNITIGNADGISTLSTRNNAGTLKLTGDALSANGGKLSINLTSGSTWTGRADDYQDADLDDWADKHEEQFNPKFSHDIAASGDVSVNLAQGATWNVTGQSWISELNGNGVVDLTKAEGSDAVHIGKVSGNNTFIVNLKPGEELSTSDMLYIADGTSAAQTLQINNREEVLSGMGEGDRIRFATVANAGNGFGNVTDGTAILWQKHPH